MSKQTLKLIKRGPKKFHSVNGVQIRVTARESLPDSVEIMVFEEDTSMVLTIDKEVCYREEHPIRTFTAIHNAPKKQPGSLVKNGRSWYALVVDLDADAVCQPRWIEAVYREIFQTIKTNKITAAGMHLLGSTHGKIPPGQTLKILFSEITSHPNPPLKYLYLVADQPVIENLRKQIAGLLDKMSLS